MCAEVANKHGHGFFAYVRGFPSMKEYPLFRLVRELNPAKIADKVRSLSFYVLILLEILNI